jgi:hypothetical protein
MIWVIAPIEVKILFVFFFKKQKDWNEKRENGWLKMPEPFASNKKATHCCMACCII